MRDQKTAIATRAQAQPVGLETIPIGALGAQITNASQLWNTCQAIASTEMVPERLRNKPAACFAVAMLGMPLGFDFMTSIRRIEMFSGKPSLPGELMLAVLRRQADLVHFAKGHEGKPFEDDYTAWIETQRGNFRIERSSFSVADAKCAGLWDKKGPWQQYPKAMLFWRAVGIHCREHWSDRMNGLQPTEEAEDYATRATQARNVTPERGDVSAVKILLDQSEAQASDPLLETYTAEPDVLEPEPGETYDLRISELKVAIDRLASDTLTGDGDFDEHRAWVKAQLVSQVGVQGKPTLEQLDAMLRSAQASVPEAQ